MGVSMLLKRQKQANVLVSKDVIIGTT